MEILNWIQTNGQIISLVATIVLVLVTAVYVYLTKKILDSTVRQSQLVPNPVIGIKIGKINISEVWGPNRRSLNIGLNLINLGNAPAIGVLVDAEIILQYSNIKGEKVIPARFEPRFVPYIRPGEEVTESPMHNPTFGNNCIIYLLDDFRECNRLNIKRIETDPTKEANNASVLKIIVYCKNNLGQFFESTYETYLGIENIPKNNEKAELTQYHLPRQKFYSAPIQKSEVDKNLSTRESKRELCGW